MLANSVGQQVGGALDGGLKALSILGVVCRFQRGRKEAPDQGSLLQLCLGATGSAVGRISMGHSPPGLPPLLLSLVDHGPYQARDHMGHVGLGCPLVATMQKFS